LLKPGGSLIVVDNEPATALGDLGDVIPHRNGFSEEDVRTIYEPAGVDLQTYKHAADYQMEGYSISVFIAKGIKVA
jgi:hypothetical protein